MPSACSKKNSRASIRSSSRRRARRRFRPAARSRSIASASRERVEARLAAHPRHHASAAKKCRTIPLDRPVDRRVRAAAVRSALARSTRSSTRSSAAKGAPALLRCGLADRRADSIDESPMYRKSRYDKGDGDDYLNIPLDREAVCSQFVARSARRSERTSRKISKPTPRPEACRTSRAACRSKRWPHRGEDTLRFGPLKPVGLRDPATGKTPYAVVQLRKENVEGTAFNLVGFQTRLTWPAQKEAFGKLPGLAERRMAALGRDASQHVHRFAAVARRAICSCVGDASVVFRRTNHRRRRLRRSRGLRRDDGRLHAARAMLGIAAHRSSARDGARRGRRASAEHRDGGFSAGERHVGLTSRRFRASTLKQKQERRAKMAERALLHLDAFVRVVTPRPLVHA